MIIGIIGKAQAGKDSICKIIQALDIYSSDYGKTPIDFVKECLTGSRLDELELFRDITSKWEKHSFAEKLKECAAIILGCNVEFFEQGEFKNQIIPWLTENIQTLSADGFGEFDTVPITVRKFLQKFGTEVGRNIDNDLWIKVLFRDYSIKSSWIIPDVRFPNEANAIKEKGGILIRVERTTTSNDTHPSETALDNYNNFDYTVYNNGSWDYFINQVMNIVYKENIVCID